jgi:hypothetical protein
MSNKTFKQICDAVLAALGFIGHFTNPPVKTLLALRNEIHHAIGLGTALTLQVRTLGDLRKTMYATLGWAGQTGVSNPAMDQFFNEILNQADQLVYRRLEFNNTGVFPPARMVGDNDVCNFDYTIVTAFACAMAAAHYGKPEAQLLMAQAEKGFADWVGREPTNFLNICNTQIIEAHATVFRRYEMTFGPTFTMSPFAVDGDVTSMDYLPVYLLALSNLKALYKQPDWKVPADQYERFMAELEKRKPANALSVVKQMVKAAQDDLYRSYHVLHTELFFTWTLEAGVNMYDIPANDERGLDPGDPLFCNKILDPRHISSVEIQRGEIWYPLICGIPPPLYSRNLWSAWPSRYEIRKCIELWPSPGDDVQYLRVKGHHELDVFEADGDLSTIDDEPIYLLATANAKAYYNQPDAANYVGQLERYISDVTAGSHHTMRYLPGQIDRIAYIEPRPLIPWES